LLTVTAWRPQGEKNKHLRRAWRDEEGHWFRGALKSIR
jgi:hypothetical protein